MPTYFAAFFSPLAISSSRILSAAIFASASVEKSSTNVLPRNKDQDDAFSLPCSSVTQVVCSMSTFLSMVHVSQAETYPEMWYSSHTRRHLIFSRLLRMSFTSMLDFLPDVSVIYHPENMSLFRWAVGT